MAAIAGNLTTETKINDYVSVTAGADSTVVVESNSKTCAEDGKSFGYRMKLGGEGTSTQRSLKIVTAEDNAKIVIYAMSSSSSATRTAALYDSTFVDKTTTPDAIGRSAL